MQGYDHLPLRSGERYIIGRGRHCAVRLGASGIARRHAELLVADGAVSIRTLGARLFVVFNGTSVHEAGPLTNGDEILIAGETLTLLAEQAPCSAPALAPTPTPVLTTASHATEPEALTTAPPDLTPDLARRFQEAISQRLDLYHREALQTMSATELREKAEASAWALLENGEITTPASMDHSRLVAAVTAEAVGLGPLERLMADAHVTEIMVNGHECIYVERHGRLQRTDARFSSETSLRSALERIVSPLGRRIDEGAPFVDARLPDGSRVNAIIPPLSLTGPALTIRRFPDQHLTLEDLIDFEALSPEMARFLVTCIEQRQNILVAGGTGTGKTTVLNALSRHISNQERIITIEDSAELRLQQTHVVSLEARPANIEGSGAISIRELVHNALRMRPDRILVGECRGGEALDMLQAMNTGHDGSLTTAHANTPRDAVARLEVMTLMAGFELPLRAIREQISAAVDIIVQLTRFADGSRRITAITEVDGMESDRILLNDLFIFQRSAGHGSQIRGQHQPTGQIPKFYQTLQAEGQAVDLSTFQARPTEDLHKPELQTSAF